ncbi:MAG: hypothetical protein N2379_10940, partial [Verrucomicrobiae bacterium]|nr:hypothetical protein [Verrucomicrobiae bacterium]
HSTALPGSPSYLNRAPTARLRLAPRRRQPRLRATLRRTKLRIMSPPQIHAARIPILPCPVPAVPIQSSNLARIIRL